MQYYSYWNPSLCMHRSKIQPKKKCCCFVLFFHINLEREKKGGGVQSDTAKLEQSEELLCQVNDRREERKSACPRFHPG